jgi:hypothetical protein
MTDQHRATPEQWAYMHERTEAGLEMTSCILELRDTIRALCKARNDLLVCSTEQNQRIEALEAAQLEQAESHRFCTDAIVRRVEALEAYDKEDANCWAMVRSGMHALRERIEALEAAQQDKLDRLIALDREDPTPDPAMTELRAASAEARPAGGLVERIEAVAGGDARAAIREVVKWIQDRQDSDQVVHTAYEAASWLRIEANRG